MWRDHVLPRLRARGLGADRAAETLRLTGIGESSLVDLIGEDVLRTEQPAGRDLRPGRCGGRARVAPSGSRVDRRASIVDETIAGLMPLVGPYVFARGDEGWPDAIGRRLGGRTARDRRDRARPASSRRCSGPRRGSSAAQVIADGRRSTVDLAASRRRRGPGLARAGLAVDARPADDDMRVEVAVDVDGRVTRCEHTAFRAARSADDGPRTSPVAALWTTRDASARTEVGAMSQSIPVPAHRDRERSRLRNVSLSVARGVAGTVVAGRSACGHGRSPTAAARRV